MSIARDAKKTLLEQQKEVERMSNEASKNLINELIKGVPRDSFFMQYYTSKIFELMDYIEEKTNAMIDINIESEFWNAKDDKDLNGVKKVYFKLLKMRGEL